MPFAEDQDMIQAVALPMSPHRTIAIGPLGTIPDAEFRILPPQPASPVSHRVTY